MKTVEIEINDQGQVTVGEPPQAEETGQPDMQEDKSYMRPAASVDEALNQARTILSSASTEDRNAIAKEVWPPKGATKPGMGNMGGMGGM